MKLLIVCNAFTQIDTLKSWIEADSTLNSSGTYQVGQHEISLLSTGYGGFQVGFHTATKLAGNQYHLVIKAGLANSFKADIALADIVNIINDKPGDVGTLHADSFEDLYDKQLLNIHDKPHQMGGFVNKTNAYINVFLPFRKVLSLTVNTASTNAALREIRQAKYKPHIETPDGLPFAYACLWRGQPFYHLCAIAENFASGEKNEELALRMLNDTLIDIIQKL